MARRFLLVVADDFGYSKERDEGIVECFKSGAISATSLMVNGVSAASAVQLAKAASLPMDLHLNLTEGIPVGESPYRTLVDSKGFMHGMYGFRDANKAGKVDLKEVETEIFSQIDKFKKLTGDFPTKVDGHQHVHLLPGIAEVFARCLSQRGIRLTRVPVEPEASLVQHSWSIEALGPLLQQVSRDAKTAREIFKNYDIRFPLFTGLRTMGKDMTVQRLQHCILEAFSSNEMTSPLCCIESSQSAGEPLDIFCEVMTHPGNITGTSGGCGDGPDDFSQSADRVHEINILNSEDMKKFYMTEHFQLVSFSHVSFK